MPKIQKKKIEQCTKIFIYRDLKYDSSINCKGFNYINPKSLIKTK